MLQKSEVVKMPYVDYKNILTYINSPIPNDEPTIQYLSNLAIKYPETNGIGEIRRKLYLLFTKEGIGKYEIQLDMLLSSETTIDNIQSFFNFYTHNISPIPFINKIYSNANVFNIIKDTLDIKNVFANRTQYLLNTTYEITKELPDVFFEIWNSLSEEENYLVLKHKIETHNTPNIYYAPYFQDMIYKILKDKKFIIENYFLESTLYLYDINLMLDLMVDSPKIAFKILSHFDFNNLDGITKTKITETIDQLYNSNINPKHKFYWSIIPYMDFFIDYAKTNNKLDMMYGLMSTEFGSIQYIYGRNTYSILSEDLLDKYNDFFINFLSSEEYDTIYTALVFYICYGGFRLLKKDSDVEIYLNALSLFFKEEEDHVIDYKLLPEHKLSYDFIEKNMGNDENYYTYLNNRELLDKIEYDNDIRITTEKYHYIINNNNIIEYREDVKRGNY